MSADFSKALETVLAHEGGYSDHPSDKGGATRYGISARFLQSIKSDLDPRTITLEQASDLYYRHFWLAVQADQIQDQLVATKVFDIAVNAGPYRAIRILQESLVALGYPVQVDGKIGPRTLSAITGVDPQRLTDAICDHQLDHYRQIIARDEKQSVFWLGWKKRSEWGRSC